MKVTIQTLHPHKETRHGVQQGKVWNYHYPEGNFVNPAPIYGYAVYELSRTMEKEVGGSFEGSILWYVTTAKFDLEARGMSGASQIQDPKS